jgi:hypothetical protein
MTLEVQRFDQVAKSFGQDGISRRRALKRTRDLPELRPRRQWSLRLSGTRVGWPA